VLDLHIGKCPAENRYKDDEKCGDGDERDPVDEPVKD
jgi:hypothetical protein